MTMTLQVPLSADMLSIVISESDGRAVVALRGVLDAVTAPKLSAQFAQLSRDGYVEIDVELSQLDSMDSTGLSVVVDEHKRTQGEGGRLLILSPNRLVIRLFQTSGLMSYLVVKPRMSV
jgi:anti-sigma B factor antagonist